MNYTAPSYENRKFIAVLTNAKRILSTSLNAISLEIHFNILRVSEIFFSHSGLDTKMFLILLSCLSVNVNVSQHRSINPSYTLLVIFRKFF